MEYWKEVEKQLNDIERKRLGLSKTYKIKKDSPFGKALEEAVEDKKVILDCIENEKEFPKRIKKKLKT